MLNLIYVESLINFAKRVGEYLFIYRLDNSLWFDRSDLLTFRIDFNSSLKYIFYLTLLHINTYNYAFMHSFSMYVYVRKNRSRNGMTDFYYIYYIRIITSTTKISIFQAILILKRIQCSVDSKNMHLPVDFILVFSM